MITVGIDAGTENMKVVILGDNRILSHSIISQGREAILLSAQIALSEAIEKAGITFGEIGYVVATGMGSDKILFAHEQVTKSSCGARGANWLLPSTGTLIDMGADKNLVVRCQGGKPVSTVWNDRCASGTSRFLKIAAKPLGVDVTEMGRLSLQSHENIDIENTCAVFAESEIISLIHSKHPPEDIARAVFRGLARRIYTMIVKVGFKKDLIMIGGIAKNVGMVKAMEDEVSCHILVPDEPMIVGALGAAIIGTERHRVSLKDQSQARYNEVLT